MRRAAGAAGGRCSGEPFLTRARKAGANVVLVKPVVWSRLADMLRNLHREDRVAA
jgi:hypothetical protein